MYLCKTDVLCGIFCSFCYCNIHWYLGTAQKSSYMQSVLIIKNKNKCQFWTPLSLTLLSETGLQLAPLFLDTEIAFVWYSLACWILSAVCISATVAFQMVKQRWQHSPEPPVCGWDLSPQKREILLGTFQRHKDCVVFVGQHAILVVRTDLST